MGDNELNENRPHVKSGPIKYTKGYSTRKFVSKIINASIILLILAVVATAIFVYIKEPVKTNDGYITAESIYEILEHGEKVVIVEGDGFNLFTPIERFLFTQEAYPVRIIAGPYGKIDQMKGKFRVTDGINVVSVNLENPKEYLDLEYVARKIDSNGNPLPEQLDIILTKDEVLGSFAE